MMNQRQIRIYIHAVAEETGRPAIAVFKIAFVLRIAGGIDAVAAPDQHDGKSVLRRDPDHPFMAVDEPVLTLGEFRAKLAALSHHQQFMIRAAEADDDADGDFSGQEREAEGGSQKKVNQQKQAAPVFGGKIGKTPYISQEKTFDKLGDTNYNHFR